MEQVIEKKENEVDVLLQELSALKIRLSEVEKDKKLYEGWYYESKTKYERFRDAVKSVVVLVD